MSSNIYFYLTCCTKKIYIFFTMGVQMFLLLQHVGWENQTHDILVEYKRLNPLNTIAHERSIFNDPESNILINEFG